MLERRKRRRFPVQQPVFLKRLEKTGFSEVHGISENASEVGVLLLASRNIPLGTNVEVTLTMPNNIELRALGTVVRIWAANEKEFATAVACMHTFSETAPTASRAQLV